MSFEWMPLLEQILRANKPLTAHELMSFPSSEPMPILHMQAKRAFVSWGAAFLKALGKHLGIDFPAGASIVEVVKELVGQILKPSEAEMLAILRLRCPSVTEDDMAADCMDTAHDLMIEPDNNTVMKERDTMVVEEDAVRGYADSFKKLMATYRGNKKAAPSSASSTGKSAKKALSRFRGPTKLSVATTAALGAMTDQ